MNTKFPLYLGIFFLVISVLTVSIKVGERTVIQSGLIKANENKAFVSLSFAYPDKVSINLVSTKEVIGGDFSLKYDSNDLDILPSTLTGASGFITTGGEIDKIRGNFSFSAVNPNKAVKNGILATFRINGKTQNADFKNKVNIDFNSNSSKLLDINSNIIEVNYSGLN